MNVQKSLKTTLLKLILLTIALSTLVSSFFITVNFYLDYKKSVITSIKKITEKVSEDINKVISLGLTLQDIPGLENDLKDRVKFEKNLSYIVITDKNNVVNISTVDSIKDKKFSFKEEEEVQVNGISAINLITTVLDTEKKPAYYIYGGLKSSVLKQKIYSTLLLFLVTSLTAIGVSFAISKKILDTRVFQPLIALKESTSRVSEGDLNISLSTSFEDEVGLVTKNFSLMVLNLKEIIQSLKEGVYQLSLINDTAEELSHNVKEGSERQLLGSSKINSAFTNIENRITSLKERVESLNEFIELTSSTFLEISSSSEEIFKTMEELMRSVERIDETYKNLNNINVKLDDAADRLSREIESILSFVNQIDASLKITLQNVTSTANLSDRMNELANYSKKTIQENMKSVERMAEISAESRASFLTLKSNIEKISDILNVIEEITEQTNMLALNAAIIAAQTEESGGKAFSVVAEEIKGLSRRTQSSTKEIAELIESIVEQTEKVFNKLNDNAMEGENASKKAKEVEENIGEIINLVEKVTLSVKEVLKSANEQATGSNTLSREVEDLRKVADVLISVKEEGNRAGRLLGELVEFISRVVNKVGSSVKEQNDSIGNVKKSVIDLSGFSRQLSDYISKEKAEISQTMPLISEIEKLAEDNNKQARNLEEKLVELKNLGDKFNDIIRRFTV
ncbi:MAG: methyl-accepting chemotaxis protein [Proteobacteria bacterium]|nr:methyl-accepting chemotaxis protein [Pseudomonadota bacterium]